MLPLPSELPAPVVSAAERRGWLWPALLLVAGLRLWRLPQAALPDYDSVRNWQIIQEVAAGDFAHLFHHGSPAFYLLYAPVTWLSTDYRVLLVLNALLAVAAVGLFADWVARAARLRGPETALLTLLAGSSVFLTFSGRDFTMSSMSLLLLVLLLRTHWQRLQQPTRRHLLRTAAVLALGLSVNYKFLLTVPILAVLELLQADRLAGRGGNWWRVLLVLAAPFVGLGVLAWLVSGVPVYRWPAVFFVIMFPAAANAAGRHGTVQVDFAYYLRYLLDFEAPLLPALAAALVWFSGGLRRRPLPMATYLLVWAALMLAGMSLLIKAPRGLLFGYLPLYALLVLLLTRWARPVALLGLLAAVGYNMWQVQRHIYAYLPTRYPLVAGWLQQHDRPPVATTVGPALLPVVAPLGLRAEVAKTPAELAALHRQGYRYVLLDDYYRVAGVPGFDSLRQLPAVAAWPEPALTSPLLYLEHSEYTGLGYQATLRRQRQAAQDTLQLRLIWLPQ
ncbi:hypothetical protein [Hymenobacter jeollabukensis]|uniref:Glycosyltransferase RgtA/B/C/D-like domain-containing protein n=1 Tax=Hymenobacter jeollabukensis TaxID=2025313 RepID=A0A5R8WQ77_9BACT|nr:hypothetical protein [Hymenobacter jeollabukensis]TLM92448.1 hypothetical protein FDY95_13555 [Hymenobacter jeollabukensis]